MSHCYFTAQLLFLSNRPKRNVGMQDWTRDGRVNGKKTKKRNMENTHWKGAGLVEDDQLLAAVDHLDGLGEDRRLVPETSSLLPGNLHRNSVLLITMTSVSLNSFFPYFYLLFKIHKSKRF